MTQRSALPAVWGLTGGIASGKSTVAALLAERGCSVIDADAVSRELSSPGGAAEPFIRTRFGTTDRKELSKIVFSDPKARRDLEAILHPLIQQESQRRFVEAATKTPGAPIIYEAALLIEAGRKQDFTGLIVVEADDAIREERLIRDRGMTAEQARAILASQLTNERRRAHARHLIVNNGSRAELEAQVRGLKL